MSSSVVPHTEYLVLDQRVRARQVMPSLAHQLRTLYSLSVVRFIFVYRLFKGFNYLSDGLVC
jgi:transcriptional regulator NrdR family protein